MQTVSYRAKLSCFASSLIPIGANKLTGMHDMQTRGKEDPS